MPITLEERPIFVTGSERSGTTLIMTILGCHPKLAVPEVTWYYPRFRPYLLPMATCLMMPILLLL